MKTLGFVEEIAKRQETETLAEFRKASTMKVLLDLVYFPHSPAVVERVLSICTELMSDPEFRYKLRIESRLWLFLTRSLTDETPQKVRVAALTTLDTLLSQDLTLAVQVRDNGESASSFSHTPTYPHQTNQGKNACLPRNKLLLVS